MARLIRGGPAGASLVVAGALLLAGAVPFARAQAPDPAAPAAAEPAAPPQAAPEAPTPEAPAAPTAPGTTSIIIQSSPPGMMPAPDMGAPMLSSPGFTPFGGPPAAAAPRQGPDCQGDVNALRGDLEQKGNALQAAIKKKQPPTALCPMFRRLAVAQDKFVSYLTANQTACGVPADILKKLKANNAQLTGTRDKVCQIAMQQEQGGGAAGPAGPPPQGSLSSGLGLPSAIPSSRNAKPGNLFDTLNGNALR
ncbi:MAG TPA: hypothetical protein VLA00_14945 [Xanthobacteraceae bacterium]|nr:hypothetical protein [Xanthobacteraceae bacterium]